MNFSKTKKEKTGVQSKITSYWVTQTKQETG